MRHFTDTIKKRNQILVGTFKDLKTAKEVRRLLELGCIPTEGGYLYGRIIQKDNMYMLYEYDKNVQ
jgi:hypothetical protein